MITLLFTPISTKSRLVALSWLKCAVRLTPYALTGKRGNSIEMLSHVARGRSKVLGQRQDGKEKEKKCFV